MCSFMSDDGPDCYRPPEQADETTASMLFPVAKHFKECFETFNILRQNRKLCDVVLRSETEVFYAHKVVLSAASPYFRAMFTSGMKECKMAEIKLHTINARTLSVLLDYAYTGEVLVSEKNVCSLLPAATICQMNHVTHSCCVFLQHQLDPSNCIGIADFAKEYGCKELYNKATEYLYSNFPQVSRQEEFYMLSEDRLRQLIKKDELNVRCESEVLDAVLRWTEYDKRSRLCKLQNVICSVRCHFLPPKFLREKANTCNLLAEDPVCRRYLERIAQDLEKHNKCPERQRDLSARVIYTAGGYLRHSLAIFECFCPNTKTWYRLPDIPTPRSGLAMCMLRGMIYLVGGRNNSVGHNVDSALVDCYDPASSTWHSCKNLSVPRNRVCVGVIYGKIYAVGGSHGTTHHASAEIYCPFDDSWTTIKSMQSRRIGVGVAVVNRFLYAVGGFDGQNRLKTVERYHPERNEWQFVSPMHTHRSGSAVIAHDQFIYSIGGYDNRNQLSSVERYSVETDQWTFVAPMSSPRSALSATLVCDRIYALGGYDGNEFLTNVDCYDTQTGVWTQHATMNFGRSGHGACAAGTPNLRLLPHLPIASRDQEPASALHHHGAFAQPPGGPPAPLSAPTSASGNSR